jgi:hypothetical protein
MIETRKTKFGEARQGMRCHNGRVQHRRRGWDGSQ